MIISRTPFRISFFGGGTDYPAWYRTHGGAVLATAINKYCYITCRHLPPFFEHRIRVVYSQIENRYHTSEIDHPSIRAILEYLNIEHGVEIHHDGDLPARSGMGSSSAFSVGLLNAMHALLGHMSSKQELADQSIYIEQNVLKETVGSQDQMLAAYGGFNRVTFRQTGEITVDPMTLPRARVESLNDHLMLFYTGIKRTASDVASSYVPGILNKNLELSRIREMVDEACAILCGNGPLKEFGKLLHESWLLKQSLSASITNPAVDELYNAARASGALGGKLIGAGGGGFMLLFVPPERQIEVRNKLADVINVPIKFEHAGSQIIFFDRQEEFSMSEASSRHEKMRVFRELGSDT